MFRIVLLITMAVLAGACDPINIVSASETISGSLDQACILDALRTADTVESAGSGEGYNWAILAIPNDLELPEDRPDVGVGQRMNQDGELELYAEMLWVGTQGTDEYRAFAQGAVDDLLERTIERCVANEISAPRTDGS